MFITFEGGEGVGKTTQIKRLAEILQNMGKHVLVTREPGGTAGGLEIRRLLTDNHMPDWDPMAEYMLLLADRKHHVQTVVLPALEEGAWVLCDRFQDSSVVYQGWVKGLDLDRLDAIYKLVMNNFWPNLTFVFDAPVDVAFQRVKVRGQALDRFESQDRTFHEKVRHAYLALAQRYPERAFHYIDVDDTVDNITHKIIQQIVAK